MSAHLIRENLSDEENLKKLQTYFAGISKTTRLTILNFLDEVGGQNALMKAAGDGKPECVNFLINKGANIDLPNGFFHTPLMFAAGSGNIACVRYIVQAHENQNAAKLTNGFYNAIRLMFSMQPRAWVDAKNIKGDTALMIAAAESSEDIVKYLIRKNASLKIKNRNGETPLDVAKGKSREIIIDRLGVDVEAIAKVEEMTSASNPKEALGKYIDHKKRTIK